MILIFFSWNFRWWMALIEKNEKLQIAYIHGASLRVALSVTSQETYINRWHFLCRFRSICKPDSKIGRVFATTRQHQSLIGNKMLKVSTNIDMYSPKTTQKVIMTLCKYYLRPRPSYVDMCLSVTAMVQKSSVVWKQYIDIYMYNFHKIGFTVSIVIHEKIQQMYTLILITSFYRA